MSMLAYVAPENLKDIYYPYKRSCEIYRCVCPTSPLLGERTSSQAVGEGQV